MASRRVSRLFPKEFRVVGQKEVFLPDFVVTLLRTPKLDPHYAKFKVPLNINKLDLKDYLYHAYGIQAQHIRSMVVQKPVTQNSPKDTRPAPRRWFRPQSEKYMTVQLDKPFVWPEEPEDYSPWDRDTYDLVQEAQREHQKKFEPEAKEASPEDADKIREQARRLLSGEEKWRPGAPDVRMFSRVLTAKRGKGRGVATLEEKMT